MAVHLILLAGGRGTRFWPLSRHGKPKQLLPLVSEFSMLRETWNRVSTLGRAERAWVITSDDLAPACREEIAEIPGSRFIGEPVGRNTGPAMALAGVLALADDPRAVLAVFPSDHHITRVQEFRRLVKLALHEARETDSMITLGIKPDRPETGYGYIEIGGRAVAGKPVAVKKFVEKPGSALAKKYLAGGRHLWNSGMFFFSARTLKRAFLEHQPETWRALEPLAADPGSKRFQDSLAAVYPALDSIPFDVAIMEKVSNVKVIPAEMGWNDVGHWLALGDLLGDTDGNQVDGQVLAVDSSNNIVHDRDGLTALLGVENLVVVRTGDLVLVCHRDRAQDIREVVARLKQEKKTEYL
jgi:mannose-1-phosphate guanylyltransferase